MKHEQYNKAFMDLRSDIKHEIVTQLIKEKASEIELHNSIVHLYYDDQINEVIKRVDIVAGTVILDDTYNSRSIPIDKLTLDELLAILQAVETGSYEVWAEFED